MAGLLGPIGARIEDGAQKYFPSKPRGLFLAEDFDNGEYVAMLGSPAGVPREFAAQAFFRAQRAQGVHWVTDPTYGAVGDGVTDDTAAFHAAIGSGARTIYVPDGTFSVDPITLASGVVFRGAGIGRTILKLRVQSVAAPVISGTGLNGVVVSDLTVDGNRANQTITGISGVAPVRCNDVTVERVYVTGTNRHGITISGDNVQGASVRARVLNCRVDDYGTDAGVGWGIGFFSGVDDSIAAFNHVSSARPNLGIVVDDRSSGPPSAPSRRNRIVSNIIHGNSTITAGIDIEGSVDTAVIGNLILEPDDLGICLIGTSEAAAEWNVIANNQIIGQSGTSGTDAAIRIQSGYAIVEGNLCKDSAAAGILVIEASAGIALEHLIIRGNVVRGGAAAGISVQKGRFVQVVDNDIDCNGAGYGIRVVPSYDAMAYIHVDRNSIRDAAQHGIDIQSKAAGALTDFTVRNNRIVNVGLSGAGGLDGIFLVQVTNELARGVISGNRMRDDQGVATSSRPIEMDGTPTEIDVFDNRATGFLSASDYGTATLGGFGTGDAGSVQRIFTGSKTWDPASVAAGAQATTTVIVTGATLGDVVTASFSLSLQGMQLTGEVTAASTVTVLLRNGTGAAIDLASGTLRAKAERLT